MAARRYGRRLRRGAAGTAVAAAAMAALSASQAPGFLPVAHAAPAHTEQQTTVAPPPGPAIDGDTPYITDMPPLNTPTGPPLVSPTPGAPGGPSVNIPTDGSGLPATVLAAYQRAEASVAESDPGCHLPWELLAAIGQVESNQARHGAVDANGTTYKPILGPVLDGNGFANISDTDGGRYDGDPVHDRAVGPMQFIPSTWEHWGADGNGDGRDDPNNIYDAALAAAHYLCADGRDLAVPAQMDRAILGYNHSQAYLALVRAWYDHFTQGGAVSVPDSPGTPAAPAKPGTPSSPPTTTPPPAAGGGGESTTPVEPGGGTTTPPPTDGGTTTPPPTTPPTDGGTTTPPPTDGSGDPTTPPTDPTDPGDPTTPPVCESPTPTDSATPTPTPTDSGTPTEDPCATATPTPEETPSGEASPSASQPATAAVSVRS
ncbi:lytic murein transglycosylase [Streptomyces sp. NPDC004031]